MSVAEEYAKQMDAHEKMAVTKLLKRLESKLEIVMSPEERLVQYSKLVGGVLVILLLVKIAYGN